MLGDATGAVVRAIARYTFGLGLVAWVDLELDPTHSWPAWVSGLLLGLGAGFWEFGR